MWDFAAGCMRTYLALAERGRATSTRCPRSRRRSRRPRRPSSAQASVDGDDADTLKAESEALDALAERGYYNERLDQLLVEVLLGVR